MSKSHLEYYMESWLNSKYHNKFIQEYRFDTTRKWRFDFAWVDLKIAIECEGGIWSGGRHTRGIGFSHDCEKYNKACILGWSVLRYTTENMRLVEFDLEELIRAKLVDKNIENKKELSGVYDFELIWKRYPKKLGKHEASRHFKAQVKKEKDFLDIQIALDKFLSSDQAKGDPKFIPHGSSWFNHKWRDWIDYVPPQKINTDENGVPMEWRTKK